MIIPLDYRKVFIAFIKKALTEAKGGEYFEKFYRDTLAKSFSFSVVFKQPDFKKDKIILGANQLKVLFTAIDDAQVSLIMYMAFIEQKNKAFPLPFENEMVLRTIYEKKAEKIETNKVIFKTAPGSGLCVREHNRETNGDNYYVFNDEAFTEKLFTVLRSQAERAGFNKQVAEKIRCKPLNCKKVVVKHYGCLLNISIGMLQMEADVKLLQYFYDAGIGSRHSAGFGLVDLVAQDLF
ncbi:CRISPR-associated endoribonuclease Cas6 [Acetobacterium woodii DSM 1030]|uniref:CRISPR-associated endoribonuclease Cas6 n=2 Tax=Acetobacterium woodii TaxID=33952 RepID=H6LHF9_ACEWD|nr:CRISPR-associated endoribonuclease Cas6 [Acetobacterium woodii DSM 1030]